MTSEEFVEALYRVCLGRSAEPSGLAHWTDVIRASGDPTTVLQGLLASEEYRLLTAYSNSGTESREALPRLNRRLRIVDVGAQSLGIGSHPYSALLEISNPEIIGFDPLRERLEDRANREPSSGLTLLPYALGDGEAHTLYINNDDATSSLFPLNHDAGCLSYSRTFDICALYGPSR